LLHGRTVVPLASRGVVATARISEFLEELAEKPDRELLFDKEPIAVMTTFGLTEAQQRLLLKGTLPEIREAIEQERSDSDFVIFMIKMK
jgi:hypothetical protein